MNSLKNNKGFTLLELLIVTTIVAVIGVMVVIIINPVETLKQSRDIQRIADLNTLKKAIVHYIGVTSRPSLDGANNTLCAGYAAKTTIWVSATSTTPAFPYRNFQFMAQPTSTETAGAVNGTGWLPINFEGMSGGSSLANLPLDPINIIVGGEQINWDGPIYHYHYSCRYPTLGFELGAQLESEKYITVDKLMVNDGGDDVFLYQVGTDLKILPMGPYM